MISKNIQKLLFTLCFIGISPDISFAQNSPISMQIVKDEGTADRRSMPIFLVDSSNAAVTGAVYTGSECTIRKNGGSSSNCAGTVSEMASGEYKYVFTSGEVDSLGYVCIKLDDSGVSELVRVYCAQVINMNIHGSPTAQVTTGGITAGSFAAGALDAAALATDAAQEIRDTVMADTSSELSACPSAASSLEQKIDFIYELSRHKVTCTSSSCTLFKDDGSTSLCTWAPSDNGTTAAVAEAN